MCKNAKNKRWKKTLFGVCLFLLGRVLIIKKLSHTHTHTRTRFDAERQNIRVTNCNSVVHSRVDDDENKRPRQRGAPCSSATCFFLFLFLVSLISSASWKTWREFWVKDVRKKKNQSGFHLDSIIYYKETLLLVSGVYIIKRDVGGRCWPL